jgi:hypothetical protein
MRPHRKNCGRRIAQNFQPRAARSPGADCGAASSAVDRWPDLDKDILQHLFGGHLAVQHPISRRKQGARKPIVEFLETQAIALSDPFQKLDFGFEFFCVIRFHKRGVF